ncbi:Major Facilitator Superfamily transporter [Caldisphaera lagunensis DSM 15908]|uniref:Major Facilitator Superfamily transporter n=1 Tax=Caldisphaera lagunensis (strain DSM 15908 / JCM 11604 / ANMR 0165 / IC-154) TaxID=1056495 RepID=L0AA14_CALLD|nr:MFS transporter [Caldisphaera lagunensis]AFZ70696.1 Major Facilitator Superfamily transporter [Caldisphaera lagunensis DSM 15908]
MGIKLYKDNWMYALIPYNIAMGPLSTLITLQILRLGGNVIDVAYTISLANLTSIIGSLIWGFAADYFDRKKQILLSLSTVGLTLVAISYTKSISLIEILYSILSFLNTASSTPLSLLIMSTVRKDLWASSYAKLNYLSSVGYLIGLLGSSLLAIYFKLDFIVILMGILVLISFGLSYYFIPKPELHIERTALLHNLESFLIRLKQIPTIFIHFPSKYSFKIFSLSRLKSLVSAYVPLLYIGMFLFYIASGIFNTEYPAGLKEGGLSNSLILIIFSIGMLFQIISYYLSPRFINKLGKARTSWISLLMRGSSYFIIGLLTVIIANKISLILSGIIFYPIAAGLAFSAFYTASSIMIFEIVKSGKEGSTLGVYSTLTGIAMTLGSFVSGYMVRYMGFGFTYIIAGIILLFNVYIFKTIERLPR